MSGYFPTAHKHNAFGVLTMAHSKRRPMERTNVAFPLRFSSKMMPAPTTGGLGAASIARPATAHKAAILGRKAAL